MNRRGFLGLLAGVVGGAALLKTVEPARVEPKPESKPSRKVTMWGPEPCYYVSDTVKAGDTLLFSDGQRYLVVSVKKNCITCNPRVSNVPNGDFAEILPA